MSHMKISRGSFGLLALLGLGLVVPACNYGYNNGGGGYYTGPLSWYVDPVLGADGTGNGSPAYPFKTIRVALLNSIAGDTIFLANGNYNASDAADPEVFPIVVTAGVSIVGNPSSNGTGIVIQGSGNYSVTGGSRTSPPVSAAVVMQNNAQLSGVTVTASGGTGVIFDNTSAILMNCTLTGNATGIQVFQAASPTINANVITSNTTTGLACWDNSTPLLRSNTISSNSSYGVDAEGTSVPNLGDASTAGMNVLQTNTTESLFNNTTASSIPAAGNTWNAGVQGADGSGHYSTGAANAGLSGTNYLITNAPAASIQF